METLLSSVIEDTNEEEVSYKRVPWISWNEWNFVRESLFSSSPDSIATALRRISTWRIRGGLPIIISVTAFIIEIQQKDPQIRTDLNGGALMSEEMLASLYCMAILRLVNGVVDQDRNKRGKIDKRKLSINEAADEIGLPRRLIDIRHEASHRDLPSLQLVREASVKALDWIKSYYWEPQKNAIPFQRDKIDFVRKKMKSKLRELASVFNTKQDSQLGSLPLKRKRNNHSNAIFGSNLFSHKTKKLKVSQSRGPKNQITGIFRTLFRLYTSFPSELVVVLIDFLTKALDSSGCNAVERYDKSKVDSVPETSKIQTGIIDLYKLVITRLSSKEPELILIMLKEVLQTLEMQETTKSATGKESFSCSQSEVEIHQTEQLSSLVLWLIKKYNKVKHPTGVIRGGDINNSLAETDVVPKVGLVELLKKCLLISSPDHNQLARSALLLAQIMGNSSIVDRLKKHPAICSANSDRVEESSANTDIQPFIVQHEASISQAAKMLEFLKQSRNNKKQASTSASQDDVGMNEGRWTVVKSWNPCPIGMLPCSLGSTGVLPILDRAISLPEVQNVPEKELWELNRCGGKTCGSHDAELLEKPDAIEETAVEDDQANDQDSSRETFKDRLMIGGIYKKVHSDEVVAIESAVRILV